MTHIHTHTCMCTWMFGVGLLLQICYSHHDLIVGMHISYSGDVKAIQQYLATYRACDVLVWRVHPWKQELHKPSSVFTPAT